MLNLYKPIIIILMGLCLSVASILPVQADSLKIHMLTLRSAKHLFISTHAYVIQNQAGKTLLFDTGYKNSFGKIRQYFNKNNLDFDNLSAVILSHFHDDHAGSAAKIQSYFKGKKHDPEFIAGQKELPYLTQHKAYPLCSKFLPNNANAILAQNIDLQTGVASSKDLSQLGFDLTIYQIGSHTPGSVVAVGDDFAIIGDLFRGGINNTSKANIHFSMCDLAQNREKIRYLLDDLAPNATIFYTGHFGPVSRNSLQALVNNDSKWQ